MSQQAPVSAQPPLPPEAYHYAGMYHLGQPQAGYRVVYLSYIFVGCVCLLGAGLCVAVVTSGETADPIGVLLVALLGVVGAVYYLALHPVLHGSWRIYGCTEGFVFLKGSNAVACRWDEIAFVWQRNVTYYTQGARGSSTKFTVQRSDGVRIVMTQMFRNIILLGTQMQREVTNRLAPQALAAVNAGQVVPFGPFSLSQQGLATRTEMIPWSEVQQVTAKSSIVMIQRRGQPKGKAYGGADKVPNLYVFLTIASGLVKG